MTTDDPQRSTPFRFQVPAAFTEIDLHGDPQRRAQRAYDATAVALPNASTAQRIHLVSLQEAMIERLRGENVTFAATVLAHTEDIEPRLTVAQFAVSIKRMPAWRHQSLETIADGLRQPGLARDLALVDLPSGRALVLVEDQSFRRSATILGDAVSHTHVVRQMQIAVPFPDRRRLAFVSLCTEFIRDWDVYTEVMGAIAKSITFAPTGGSSITRALDGL